MTSSDAFALKSSNLNAFLFSKVGIELNGSELTVLSILARLGQDPWLEAARLARLPKIAAEDWLADSIERMPLTPHALAEARATASSLLLLLPTHTRRTGATASAGFDGQVGGNQVSNWAMAAMVWGALALGIAAASMYSPAAPQVSEQTVQHKP